MASNADGRRASLEPQENDTPADGSQRDDGGDDGQSEDGQPEDNELPPLLKKILQEYSATGMPPAYLPKKPDSRNEGKTS